MPSFDEVSSLLGPAAHAGTNLWRSAVGGAALADPVWPLGDAPLLDLDGTQIGADAQAGYDFTVSVGGTVSEVRQVSALGGGTIAHVSLWDVATQTKLTGVDITPVSIGSWSPSVALPSPVELDAEVEYAVLVNYDGSHRRSYVDITPAPALPDGFTLVRGRATNSGMTKDTFPTGTVAGYAVGLPDVFVALAV